MRTQFLSGSAMRTDWLRPPGAVGEATLSRALHEVQ